MKIKLYPWTLCVTIHHECLDGFSIHVNLTHLQAYLLSLVIGMVDDFRTCRFKISASAVFSRRQRTVFDSEYGQMACAIICMRAKFIWSRFHPLEVWYLRISSIHHALSILNHGGEHRCQSVTFILAKNGKFSKAKDTTMFSLAIFVDVRLRETVVIFKFFTKGCCNVG